MVRNRHVHLCASTHPPPVQKIWSDANHQEAVTGLFRKAGDKAANDSVTLLMSTHESARTVTDGNGKNIYICNTETACDFHAKKEHHSCLKIFFCSLQAHTECAVQ